VGGDADNFKHFTFSYLDFGTGGSKAMQKHFEGNKSIINVHWEEFVGK
jgi:hypothetical protein